MDSDDFIYNSEIFPDTHYFVYENKRYPIKYDYFKRSSNYFQKNKEKIKNNPNIQLLDDNFDKNIQLNDETITNFIKFVQCGHIKLTRENVIGLNILSTKYEVSSLKKHTEDYIKKNHLDLAIDLLQHSEIDTTFDSSAYEEIIASNLEDHIHNERLKTLKIPILYRILTKYRLKNKNTHKQINKEIIEFLFEILKINGREASILFGEVDLGDAKTVYINRLLTEFSTVFDFHFINSTLLQTIYEAQNELIKRDEEHRKEIEVMKIQLNEIQKMKQSQQDEIQRIKQSQQDEIQKMQQIHQDEIQRIKQSQQDEIQRIKQSQQEIQKMQQSQQNEIQKIKQSQQDEIQKLKQSQQDEIQKLKQSQQDQKLVFDMKSEMMKEINKLKDELKDQKKVNENQMKAVEKELVGVFAYQKGNEFHGIIDHLTTQTGGNIHDNKTIEITTNQYCTYNEPRYVVDYNSDNGFFSKDEDGCFLCFDFKDKLIQISDYSIKSYDQMINHCHPKNWVIEVSKNGEKWDEIDRHENDPTLNGCRIIATFNIKKKIDYFYRFIRIRQTGNSWDKRGDHYFFGIDFIEFYGKIKLNLMLYHKE